MKIAIAIWDDCVSSVFDFASKLLLVQIENNQEISRSQIPLESRSLPQLVGQLKSLEVDVVICGAISRVYLEMVIASGIEVLAYVTGSIDDVLQAHLTGQLARAEFAMPGCWSGARKGFGRRQRGCRWQGERGKTE